MSKRKLDAIKTQDAPVVHEPATDKLASNSKDNRDYYQRDVITPFPIPPDVATLKLISWNIPGLRGAMKSHSTIIEGLLKTHSPDVLCLQV